MGDMFYSAVCTLEHIYLPQSNLTVLVWMDNAWIPYKESKVGVDERGMGGGGVQLTNRWKTKHKVSL